MDTPNYGDLPSVGALQQTAPKGILWGAQSFLNPVYLNNFLIDSTAVDAGNSPTTTLREGLAMGRQTSDGNLYQWNADATDGTENYAGILMMSVSMLDASGAAVDKYAHLLRSGPFVAADILIEGTAMTSHADNALLRRQMRACGCIFDDEVSNFELADASLGPAFKNLQVTGTTHTPTVAQNGTRFNYSNVAAVLVTLPAIKAGLIYEFLRVADEELVIASAEGDNVIVGNDLSADSVTITTASQQIGARWQFESIYIGSTLKWLPTVKVAPYSTGALLASSLAT